MMTHNIKAVSTLIVETYKNLTDLQRDTPIDVETMSHILGQTISTLGMLANIVQECIEKIEGGSNDG